MTNAKQTSTDQQTLHYQANNNVTEVDSEYWGNSTSEDEALEIKRNDAWIDRYTEKLKMFHLPF